jgi:2-polyprenyl-3-methyl-5-hydroxy-6-metoxy-1,4-benzoquinol methylase
MWADEDKTIAAIRSGGGVAWGDHDRRMACGSAGFFRNGYRANLVPNWLPTLDGVVDRLAEGIEVADVGCGHGFSTLMMAEAFPNSRFHGFDTHAASIQEARKHAEAAGIGARASFALAEATTYPDRQYGLVCFFDVLHDLGDPVGAARHVAKVLAPGGTVMLVEPFAHDHTADNMSSTGQLFYSASTVICCAHAISEGGHMVLGAQAGEARLAEVFRKAGFTHFRRAAETPFNMIFEVRR